MSYSYPQLSAGVKNEKANAQLQALLNQKLGAGLAVDGIFGPKTSQAVKNYQKQNGLAVDGIVGPQTWASLLAEEKPAASSKREDRTDALGDAASALKDKATAGDFSFTAREQLDQAAKDYLQRPAFSYDLQADPLYQQYAGQYIRAGRQAMEDTMGQAAAMTGGYGNSYAQTAAQQAYGSYLQQLNDRIPALYELALRKYETDTDQLRKRYALLQEMEQQAYGRHLDTLSRQDTLRAEDYEKEQDKKQEKQAKWNALAKLIALGYIPTEKELKETGMTRLQAVALAGQ